jgi:hypothetical protein
MPVSLEGRVVLHNQPVVNLENREGGQRAGVLGVGTGGVAPRRALRFYAGDGHVDCHTHDCESPSPRASACAVGVLY